MASTQRTGPITRLLIANRGEIAIRIMRACRDLGIESVAMYGPGEEHAPHVRYAGDAHRLQSDHAIPYLDAAAVVSLARSANVDAIHPGYGFLAENAEFAQMVAESGLIFVGPAPETIRLMGDKVEARRIATKAGVPLVNGTPDPVATVEEALAAATAIGFPIAVKAVGGGGGRGFRVARTAAELPAAFQGSSGEANRYFANPAVYLERYVENPRHVEVQVFADAHGHVVSLGERDCSIQRRHQKLVEESPSPAVDADLRAKFDEASIALATAVSYVGAGTIEYLLDSSGNMYFLEMNTRIQVEHPVTELVTGTDLVVEQIRVAMGEPLSFSKEDISPRGWAIECRINAEDAARDFTPTPATLTTYVAPSGPGVRVDGAMSAGDTVMPSYDSMIAKLITWGRTRDEAVARMRRALDEFEVTGPATTIPFHRQVMNHPVFVAGNATTSFIPENPDVIPLPAEPNSAADAAESESRTSLLVEVGGRRFETVIHGLDRLEPVSRNGARRRPPARSRSTGTTLAPGGDTLLSPVQGTVIRVGVETGDPVHQGQLIAVVEAMKMENELTAHRDGVVKALHVSTGGTLAVGDPVVEIGDLS